MVYVEDTGSTATTYTDANVSAGIRHVYRVKAISTAGLSQRLNYVNVTTLEHQESTKLDEIKNFYHRLFLGAVISRHLYATWRSTLPEVGEVGMEGLNRSLNARSASRCKYRAIIQTAGFRSRTGGWPSGPIVLPENVPVPQR